MASHNPVHPCRIYKNGNARSAHIDRKLAEEIKECFPPTGDYSAVFDPNRETITIFIAKPPS